MVSGFLARSAPYFRDRMMADKMFLFKVGVEVLIDSGKGLSCDRQGFDVHGTKKIKLVLEA